MKASTDRRSVCTAIGLAVLVASSAARADDKQATAQVLYDRATALMDERKFDEACPKLEEVTRLIPDGIGAKMTLAECYEGQGKLASAWSEYKRAIVAAGQKNQKDRVDRATKRARDLEGRLSTITIRVAPAVTLLPGLEVRRNDVVVGAGQLGEAVPVDPGTHTIQVKATGKRVWSRGLEIGSEKQAAVVDIGALADAPEDELEAGRTPTRGAATTIETTSVREPWQLPVGLTMVGLGVAAVGTGAALGAMALGRLSDSETDTHCVPVGDRFVCDEEGRLARDDARTLGDVSTVLFIAGGAVMATGIVFAAVPFGESRAEGIALRVGPASVGVSGRF